MTLFLLKDEKTEIGVEEDSYIHLSFQKKFSILKKESKMKRKGF